MAGDRLTVADVVRLLEEWYPLRLAENWDNVGLLLGDPDATVQAVTVCLTITPEVVEEAARNGSQLIVSHHPIFYRPTQRLTADDPASRIVLALARNGIAVFSPHTAFDSAKGGINDLLAEALGLIDACPLVPAEGEPCYKVTVFVPDSDLQRVLDAMFNAGAGVIGEYRECSFRVAGKGTFFGTEATSPTVGQKGRREEVDEWRVEVLCPGRVLHQVLAAMREAHSYEEPAFDVYPLKGLASRAEGAGRIGRLPSPRSLDDLAADVGKTLRSEAVSIVGEPDREVTRVAIACGSGGAFLAEAAKQGADVLVTGEATYHKQLEAQNRGIALILAGHYETERFGVEKLATRLAAALPGVRVLASQQERRPDRVVRVK